MPIHTERVFPTWLTLDPEDDATLEAHGWRRLKTFNTETRRWEPTNNWILELDGRTKERVGPRVRIMPYNRAFRLHVDFDVSSQPMPSGWIGPTFDDPAAVARYLWFIGDGDPEKGVAVAARDEWGGM